MRNDEKISSNPPSFFCVLFVVFFVLPFCRWLNVGIHPSLRLNTLFKQRQMKDDALESRSGRDLFTFQIFSLFSIFTTSSWRKVTLIPSANARKTRYHFQSRSVCLFVSIPECSVSYFLSKFRIADVLFSLSAFEFRIADRTFFIICI